MSKEPGRAAIRLRGVRHHNLKNFDLDLPAGRLIVVTGLSGSGKSSLAFDTLFAEGQRRYIETFSPYARQFFDRMDKPKVDRIEGIPPAIAIEQRNAVKTTRSTVGTMTELTDYMKLLWMHLATLFCRGCGEPVRKESPAIVWDSVHKAGGSRRGSAEMAEVLVTFDLPLSEKLSAAESLALVAKQGYQRVLRHGDIKRIDELLPTVNERSFTGPLTVIQDRIRISPGNRGRFVEACEQAYHFGKAKLTLFEVSSDGRVTNPRSFSNRFHCAMCDIDYREPAPAMFSFNHPLGACPTCRGFGRTITIDYNLAIPDRTKTLAGGAIKPWQVGHGLESQRDLARMCKARRIPMNVPFAELAAEQQRLIIDGDPAYGKDEEHEWPRAWYGVKGYFRWLESKAYKMHVRVLLARYRMYTLCPDCEGKRFQPEALLYHINGLTLSDFYQLPIRDAVAFIAGLEMREPRRSSRRPDDAATNGSPMPNRHTPATTSIYGPSTNGDALVLNDSLPGQLAKLGQRAERCQEARDPLRFALAEVKARLGYLNDVGLGYLTLDRPTRTLSGGETERVNLTTCLGTRLVNTLYVLDEPSVGLHPRDTDRLVRILKELRNLGNTVVVVEHEPAVMRAAEHVVDLGPGHGESGGAIVFEGAYPQLLESRESLTAQYLSGRKRVEPRPVRPVNRTTQRLRVEHASANNLKDLSVSLPLQRFVCLTGVSGSGKTTLAREVLLPNLTAKYGGSAMATEEAGPEESENGDSGPNPSGTISGWENLDGVVLVDQAPLGRTPRSKPAVYVGAFEFIRELFAATEEARQRGLNGSAFSFNSPQGQCEKCRGAGFEKIEMQFLSDVFIRCPGCDGRRYREHILEVKMDASGKSWSIADLLEATIDEVLAFLAGLGTSRSRDRAIASLKLLQDVGLGYLRAGQPINTLSGGESQRLKLVSHLAESAAAHSDAARAKKLLFIFDEPTTGLHFDDVRVLVDVFQRLVDEGHSLLVIEHNLELIRCADWLIDLGPEAGDQGGELVAEGTPADVAKNPRSLTGRALAESRQR